jgi:type I restriction enzyme S subunit
MMREYKRYDEYKDSGIEWIGDIPKLASIKKIKYAFNVINGSTPDTSNENYWNGNINWITPADLDDNKKYIKESSRTITFKGLNSCSTTLIPENNLIISSRAPIGYVSINKKDLTINQGCKALVKEDKLDIHFYYYFIKAIKNILNYYGNGTTFTEISASYLKEVDLIYFPFIDQQKIASFLDQKTAKIDEIITKKEILIDYLEKYKKSVITEAVTKGKLGEKYINEDGELVDEIEMKDSKTQFYGNIPKHLIIKKMKYITKTIIDGAHLTPTYVDDGVPFLRVTDISDGNNIDWKKTKQIPLNEHKQLKARTNPEKGDLLVSKNGTIGKTRVITWDKEFSIFVSLCLLKFVKEVDPFYIAYFFKSYALDEQIKLSGKTNTITNLHLEKIRELELLIPEQDKLQKKIVNYLDQQTTRINDLIKKTKKSIEKYKEYKKSLIFEAVTGKIDLRDYELEGGEELAEHNNSSQTERECISAVD